MNHGHSLITATGFKSVFALALLALAPSAANDQTLEEILELGPGTRVMDVLVNPSPDEPWPVSRHNAANH